MNKKVLIILLLSISLLLTSCDEKVIDEVKTENVTISEVRKPKHFRVRFRRNSDGLDLGWVSIQKHCSSWQNAQVGAPMQLQVEYYHWKSQPNQQYVNISSSRNNLSRVFGC